MYQKNLSEDLRLRLSSNDMDFLRGLSSERSVTVSECIRSIIGEYRRALESLNALSEAVKLVKNAKDKGVEEVKLSDGDTKTDINN